MKSPWFSRPVPISRRATLRGLGGLIALPFLEAMGGKTLAAAAGKSDPARLACFYIPGGIAAGAWFPKEAGRNFALAPSHVPLEKHRDAFSVLTGLSHIQGRITGHVHPYNFLTGHNINLTPGAITNTVSFDQVAAQHVGPTYLPSLALSWTNGVGTSTLSRNALGVDIPAIADYRTVFERLFPPADARQLADAKARVELDKSVLDTAVGDIKVFKDRLANGDRHRLDQYLDAIREVEKRLGDRGDLLERGRPQFDEKGVRLEAPSGKQSMREHVELMTDLIALAFQTDMTRVVTQVLGGEGGPNYNEYKDWAKAAGGQLRGAHDFHHKGSQGGDGADAKVLAARDQMFTACLARLMDKLKAIQCKDGTLLDHTVLMLGGSQVSSHSGKSFPMLLAGGSKLGFKHGQHLRWKTDEKPISNLYLTILQQMGCPVQAFKESNGTISELVA
ncbi:MAG TPA: DUF1552 domain-containing protein [Tepidisphaeraceae bacterium]|nr:DUF1552 domain-containing protein [Tepidisphaeraceae bacterium]